MNDKQKDTLDTLIRKIREKHNVRSDLFHDRTVARKDVKQLEIDDKDDDLVFLVIEIGGRDDEGTMAAVFCRDHRHIVIGKRGGCELLNPVKKGRTINRGIWHCVNNLTN